jgi:undecaprenyl-diphosphatase
MMRPRRADRLHEFDARALLAIYGGASGAWAGTMIAFTLLGGGWSTVALVPMMWHRRTRFFASSLALAITAQATLVWALKLAVGRVRPWLALGLAPPIGAPHDGSFPSGHAAGSFCLAAFLVVALPAALPQSRRLAAALSGLAFAAATLVALSRVYLGAHFPADVLAGALLGALVGTAIGSLYAARARLAVERAPERG